MKTSIIDSELYDLAKERAEKAHQATLDLSYEAGWLRGYIKDAIAELENGDAAAALTMLRRANDPALLQQDLQRHKSWVASI